MTHKLMIKTHNKTGLKYLCYTRKTGDEYYNYKGSGKYWVRHLKQHGDDVSTELLYETDDISEFKEYAKNISISLNIVESSSWANMKLEEGDGGDTVSNKMWITDGYKDIYISKSSDIPHGWYRGRSNCVFNDKNKQSEFSKKSDRKKFSITMKNKWASGEIKRDHSKCGTRGDDNPSKRIEVRNKISASRNQPVTVRGLNFLSKGDAVKYFKTSHKTLNRWIKEENDSSSPI